MARSLRAVMRAFIMETGSGAGRPRAAGGSIRERSCRFPGSASIKDLCGSCWGTLTGRRRPGPVAGLAGAGCGTMRRFDAPPRPVLQHPAVRVQKSQRPLRVAAIARGGSRMVFHIPATERMRHVWRVAPRQSVRLPWFSPQKHSETVSARQGRSHGLTSNPQRQ